MTTLELPTFTFYIAGVWVFRFVGYHSVCGVSEGHKNPGFIMIFIYLPTSEHTIYEIYKRNIAQIVIKNVRRTSEANKRSGSRAKVIEDAIIMVDKLIKHE